MKTEREIVAKVLTNSLGLSWSTEHVNDVADTILTLGIPTLRDHFAMSALQGLLAGNELTRSPTAEMAYRIADEMMTERAK